MHERPRATGQHGRSTRRSTSSRRCASCSTGPPACFSGGQAQQLAIARALVTRPRLLILDEPTEGIQPSIILEIEDAIAELHAATGMSILLVEQYVEFALRLADRYAVMDGGRDRRGRATTDAPTSASFADLLGRLTEHRPT